MRSGEACNRPGRCRRGIRIAPLILALTSPAAFAEDVPLSLADYAPYRLALREKTNPAAPLVRFRDLWDRPEAFAGRPVRVRGRIARVFRQDRIGEFPPLAEAWITSKVDDPICLVFPIAEGRSMLTVGTPVEFGGTFLKRLRYQGGDVARVAPLIVGPAAPSSLGPPEAGLEGPSWSTVDWLMGVGAASVVAMVLARRHLSRPTTRPTTSDPPPRFVDGEPGHLGGDREGEEGAADEDPV